MSVGVPRWLAKRRYVPRPSADLPPERNGRPRAVGFLVGKSGSPESRWSSSVMNRRSFLGIGGLAALAASGRSAIAAAQIGATNPAEERADYTLRIGTGLVELAPDRILSTTTYNGQFPGPLLRFKEGQRVVVDIQNDTDTPEQLHWHGQTVP